MGPLFPIIHAVLSFSSAHAAAPPAKSDIAACQAAWTQEEHQNKWGVSRREWLDLCRIYSLEDALALIKNVRQASRPGVEGGGKDVRKAGARIQTLDAKIKKEVESGDLDALYGERFSGAGASVLSGSSHEAAGEALHGLSATAKGSGLDRRKVPAPEVSDAQKAAGIKTLQDRVKTAGVSREAVAQAKFVIGEMMAHADPVIVKNLLDTKFAVHIVPKGKKLTDLPPFKHLKGQKTLDGRLWDDTKGISNMELLDGTGYAAAVAEEPLLQDQLNVPGQVDDRKNRNMVHEWGHMVMSHGLPQQSAPAVVDRAGVIERIKRARRAYVAALADTKDPEIIERALAMGKLAHNALPATVSFDEVEELYQLTMKKEGRSMLGDYADSSYTEFFAKLTEAYFDLDRYGRDNDLKLLMSQRPELAEFMYRIYGPAPSLRGK